jgi:hypothetical protein
LLNLFDIVISKDENNLLCALPVESEVYGSLISLGLSKALGPDVFTALFYVKYWEYIKGMVFLAIWNFF